MVCVPAHHPEQELPDEKMEHASINKMQQSTNMLGTARENDLENIKTIKELAIEICG